MNWQELSTTSHYQTAVAVKEKLLEGDIEEATHGIEELIEALGRSEKRAWGRSTRTWLSPWRDGPLFCDRPGGRPRRSNWRFAPR
jgi:hypothetical protein